MESILPPTKNNTDDIVVKDSGFEDLDSLLQESDIEIPHPPSSVYQANLLLLLKLVALSFVKFLPCFQLEAMFGHTFAASSPKLIVQQLLLLDY